MKINKQLSFKTTEKKVLDFKIKLRSDGITYADFLREIVNLYVTSHPSFEGCLSVILENKSRLSGTKLLRSKNLRSKAQGKLSEVVMTDEDKDRIYSLLEQEVGEL